MSRPGVGLVFAAATLALGGGLPLVTAADAGGYLDLTIGGGMVDNPSGTVDLDGQSVLGLQFAWTRDGWPVHIVVSGTLSDEGDDPYGFYTRDGDVVTAMELAAGVRRYWALGQARLFAGLGAALFFADRRLDGAFEEDEDIGTWIEGGIVWPIRNWHLGLSARTSDASVRLLGDEIEGRTSIQVVWGVHF